MKLWIPTSATALILMLSGCSPYHRVINYFSSSPPVAKTPYAQQAELDRNVQHCNARQGEACVTAGTMYEMRGSHYYSQALRYYQRATGFNTPSAYSALGHMFENGYSVPQDLSRARELYQQGAELGDGTSYLYLANIYRYGRGVSIDLSKARHNAELGCQKGNVLACSTQHQLAK